MVPELYHASLLWPSCMMIFFAVNSKMHANAYRKNSQCSNTVKMNVTCTCIDCTRGSILTTNVSSLTSGLTSIASSLTSKATPIAGRLTTIATSFTQYLFFNFEHIFCTTSSSSFLSLRVLLLCCRMFLFVAHLFFYVELHSILKPGGYSILIYKHYVFSTLVYP